MQFLAQVLGAGNISPRRIDGRWDAKWRRRLAKETPLPITGTLDDATRATLGNTNAF